MADDTEEVFDFSNPEFTREDLVTAINEMVLEYKKLSQSFKEFKAEEENCATSAGLAGSSAMQAALMLDKDLECTIVYVRCDSGYDGYHETHLIVTVYSELVPSRLAVKMRIRPPEIETSICDAKYHCFVGREHCDVLSMQIDSDLVIYRTTIVWIFQVVTICRVDKSEWDPDPPPLFQHIHHYQA
ncbi:hypothetical protein F511_33760 [Dorcoceras hygrometricum]|uniref:Uncharacterized protein n=1 Tax=Dorcoceras hygrometricum TaxID=472368 RepID=A0A2Z7DDS0_9LAMI|nr:hypothetical protein F511_33760 [Dorcoceras hygrometricum]